MSYGDYESVMAVMKSGDPDRLEDMSKRVDSFPAGIDPFLGRRWILNAIVDSPLSTIEWMLERGIDLAFRDEEGYTPLLAAIDSNRPDRVVGLDRRLAAGAPVDRMGINDWTPAHIAAAFLAGVT